MRRLWGYWALTLLMGMHALTGWSQPLERVPNPRAKDGGWVVDMAGVLSAEQRARLNRLIDHLERDTGAEVAVVILRRTQGATPKEYATELFNRWGVGKRDADNGVLLLVALGDRRVEIETGYGMEAILPDAVAGEILDTAVLPRFRAGDIAGGVIAGVEAIAERIREAQAQGAYELPAVGAHDQPPVGNSPQEPLPPPASMPVGGILLLGGVAIGLLFYALRERPPKCPLCRRPMHLLDEQADDAYLNELQRTEEQLGSVNYLVWRCEPCDTLEIFQRVALLNPYDRCPQCAGMTVRETARIVRRPTYTRTGLELILRQCKNPRCDFSEERERVLPKREQFDDEWWGSAGSSPAPSRRQSYSDDGFWGGGWSSGSGWSSGGSSASSGSFGGGAGRSW
ncbi:MAG: TPM domain-containing protein [Fimbriimonadales bacterium]